MAVCTTEDCGGTIIIARGLCQSCYHRQRRRGTLKRAYVVNSGVCSIAGCGTKSFAKNLCQKHYGQTEDPMKRLWKNIRSKHHESYPVEWDNYQAFLAAIPPAPKGASQLRRVNPEAAWSSDNLKWLLPVAAPPKIAGMSRKDYHANYGPAWNDRSKYGIEPEQRAAMDAAQNGCCAICLRPETAPNPRDPERKPRRLNIDHCHKSGAIRGLLCVRCNSLIGERGANDDPALLRRAAAYLERHAASEAA